MSEYGYLTADVFTDQPFGGNPLAMFPEAKGLAAETMQRLAAEFNLSETVFVLPPGDPAHTARLRIFTPAVELPFAGHPTVGTALILAETGRLGAIDRRRDIVLEEGAGPVPVTIERDAAGRLKATLTSPVVPSRRPESFDAAQFAAAVGLDEAALEPGVPGAIFNVGVSFAILPVRPERLAAARLDLGLWRRHFADTPAQHFYLAALDDWALGRTARVRMFAPAMGVMEDPATGAAAAAFTGFLAAHQHPADGVARWILSQGAEIGRPSEIEISADIVGGTLKAARVGGTAVLMSRGSFDLPS
ncbi:phenazine biosynthesis protein PhzF [Aliidongia dinghuensis]|uniref:Phenazine biosynthesis protein PhzF n=1 Tax=Aliidongia dinghuensis TaxID=1867774 RepID=A0A8J2YS09_9PROT|nr:PhzF family phenazine biosynthesis protein [Aliidongia dinghuensis]GGF09903.1 phenazine biosynthesis protein PhzF [Aliidongia dinghuensis]